MLTTRNKEEKISISQKSSPISKPASSLHRNISLFLPAEDVITYSLLNKNFNSIFKNEDYWRNKYIVDFGELYFPADFKAQYIAAFLQREAENGISFARYKQLNEHIKNYSDKPWAHFYLAHLAKQDLVKVHKPTEYAFVALNLGDIRGGDFIIDSFRTELGQEKIIQNKVLEAFMSALNLLNQTERTQKHICLTFCVMSKNSNVAAEKDKLKNIALDNFFGILNPFDKNINLFAEFFMGVFDTLDLVTPKTKCWMFTDDRFMQSSTVLDAMKYFLQKRKPLVELPRIHNWIKESEEKIHTHKKICL